MGEIASFARQLTRFSQSAYPSTRWVHRTLQKFPKRVVGRALGKQVRWWVPGVRFDLCHPPTGFPASCFLFPLPHADELFHDRLACDLQLARTCYVGTILPSAFPRHNTGDDGATLPAIMGDAFSENHASLS